MAEFLAVHAGKITGVLSLFDRILIKGHLPLGYPQGMERLLQREGKLFKALKGFVLQQSERIKEHARRLAEESGRPYGSSLAGLAFLRRATVTGAAAGSRGDSAQDGAEAETGRP